MVTCPVVYVEWSNRPSAMPPSVNRVHVPSLRRSSGGMWPAFTYVRTPVFGSKMAYSSVMKRVPGACRETWTFSRVTRSAGSSPSSNSVRSIASSSAFSNAAGQPFNATSPTAEGQRHDLYYADGAEKIHQPDERHG